MSVLFGPRKAISVQSCSKQDWSETETDAPWVAQSGPELDAELATTRARTEARLAVPDRVCPVCCEPIAEPRDVHPQCE